MTFQQLDVYVIFIHSSLFLYETKIEKSTVQSLQSTKYLPTTGAETIRKGQVMAAKDLICATYVSAGFSIHSPSFESKITSRLKSVRNLDSRISVQKDVRVVWTRVRLQLSSTAISLCTFL